jgi:DNA (cytosine-5)-methyltransferase 1
MESSRKAIAKCLTARGQADLHSGLQLIKEPIKVKSANSRGYDEAYIGDSINLTAINSTTRRGRVGEKKAQTLDTKCEQAVIEVESERIRRLHPIETERLQGFPDNHTQYGEYDGVVKLMSNSQRYKQCGNAVTVNVVQAIAERLKPIFKFK